ncbi:MAG TPA: hypothetical protein PK611_02905, partial [Saprospiraceae bacterium]|nr:hypothetical protein [Saprospiraceae bacterium]
MKFHSSYFFVFLLFLLIHTQVTSQWSQVSGLNGGEVQCVASSGSNTFIGTKYGILHSTNNGANWTEVNNGLTTVNVLSLAINGNNIYAGTSKGLFLSTNNGQSWKAINNGLTSTYIW